MRRNSSACAVSRIRCNCGNICVTAEPFHVCASGAHSEGDEGQLLYKLTERSICCADPRRILVSAPAVCSFQLDCMDCGGSFSVHYSKKLAICKVLALSKRHVRPVNEWNGGMARWPDIPLIYFCFIKYHPGYDDEFAETFDGSSDGLVCQEDSAQETEFDVMFSRKVEPFVGSFSEPPRFVD